MDLGLGNLIELKRRLLPATLLTQTTYDAAVTQIGRGVAGLFDKHCNRQFARVAGAIDYFSGDRLTYILSRYPVEAVTTLEIRDTVSGGWVTQDIDLIINRDDLAGLLQFGATLGSYLSQARLTYTGGYWYDTAETDPPSRTPSPATATLLPDDVKEAWYLQCQEIWDKRDKLGISLIAKPEIESKVAAIELAPIVQAQLERHRRFQIT